MVYIEQVEGGVTRLAAVFSSTYPKLVGPVRSARISDIDLLRQYGTVGLFYSGSQTPLLPKLQAAPLKLVSFDADRTGYTRQPNRPMPYDVIGDFATLRKRAGKVSTPKAVGYTFGDAPAGWQARHERLDRLPVRTWSARSGRRARSATCCRWTAPRTWPDEGGQLGPTTLIVQYSKLPPSPYFDVNHANTPFTKTVGRGKAVFFRDGKEYQGKWSRSKASQPTKYTFADGSPAVFAPGQVWIALLPKGRPVTAN